MPYIKPKGRPGAPIWIILQKPYGSDEKLSEVLSGGMGYVLKKMLDESGLSYSDCYCIARAPNSGDAHAFSNLDSELNFHKPPFILVLHSNTNSVGGWFLPELREPKSVSTSAGQMQKYAGSFLQAPSLQYPHYMMPLYGPDYCVAAWEERNVSTYIDLQKLRDELLYWKTHKALQPLPRREMKYENLSLEEILQCLERFRSAPLLSLDIETVYPRQKSAFHPHPGYPVTLGLADSSNFGVSFNLFRDSPSENRILWRSLDSLLRGAKILGQNIFNFDKLFLEALGFSISLDKLQDTLLRHHILWPELSHKLQFMTRQYTREPYYKDEGHGWSIKHMDKLRRYNCLDVCVTYEIWEAQEKEFQKRPHLR